LTEIRAMDEVFCRRNGDIMGLEDVDRCIDEIAARAVKRLDDMILAMERAADQMACGGAMDEIEVGDYPLYIEEGSELAIVCVWDAEEYFDILQVAASEVGVCLEDAEELVVHAPDAEFEESMVTGGFMAWKGFDVEKKNRRLEELLDSVCWKLLARKLAVNCSDEEYVVFRLPIHRKD
jgi:hypothetical protein